MDCEDTPKEETATPDDRNHEERCGVEAEHPDTRGAMKFISVYDYRPEGYDGTCLRPLGLCELGGSCDACWYRPDHPRFRKGAA
jgi:hypothetical protein